MEEFALCWKNFQDNIADGFHGLFLRGDLVDVTLACGDGRLLQAHKTVLAICSPYFQEIFLTNPCKHPIIVLKDVTYDVMAALLQFMYQGVVNVKHDELPIFMKIAASLQIKGLTAHEEQQSHNNNNHNNNTSNAINSLASAGGMHQKYNIAHKENQSVSSSGGAGPAKRSQELQHESYSIMSKQRRTHQPPQQRLMAELLQQVQQQQQQLHQNHHQQSRSMEGDLSLHSEEGASNHPISSSAVTEDTLMPAISLTESPFQLAHAQVKRESVEQTASPSAAHNNNNGSHSATIGNNHNNNGSVDKPLFNAPLKLEFNGHDLQAAAAVAAACYPSMATSNRPALSTSSSPLMHSNEMNMSQDLFSRSANHMEIPTVTPGEKWLDGKLEFMLSQRGKPLLVHDSHTFGIQYIRKDKKYWQCNLSRKYNCKARVTTTEAGDIIVTNNEHCHTEIRQHLRKDYKLNRLQNMSLQHAFHMNMNRLSARHSLPHSLGLTSDQQAAAALHLAKTFSTGHTDVPNNGCAMKQEEMGNGNNNNNNNESNMGKNNNGDHVEVGEKATASSVGPDEEIAKRVAASASVADWKEELFRNVAMRGGEDIK